MIYSLYPLLKVVSGISLHPEKEMKQFDEQKMVNMSDEELLGFIGGDSIRDVSPTFNKIRRWFDGLFK